MTGPARPVAAMFALAVGVALPSCSQESGIDSARAACDAYANTGHQKITSLEQGEELRATAKERAARAADASDTWAGLQSDMSSAWSRADAMTAAHNAGQRQRDGRLLRRR